MSYLFVFLGGIAFTLFLLFAWSLCRASANAEEWERWIGAKDKKE